MIRFGITGSGMMGQTHAEAIRRLGPAASLVAVYGGTRARAFAERYGIALEESAASLARRPDIDAVVISTPHHVHAEEALLAIEAGKHILLEKPMATTVEDCDRILAAAEKRKVVVSVGYNLRFRDLPIKARELVAGGAIGKVVNLHLTFFVDSDVYKTTSFGGGNKEGWLRMPENIGFVIDALPHGVDFMRWLMGAEVRTIAGFSRSFLTWRSLEDTTVGIMEFGNGAVCTVNTSCAVPGPYPGQTSHYSIIGTTGLIDMDPFGEMHLSNRKDGWKLVATQPKVGWESGNTAFGDARMKAYVGQMQAFIDEIGGRPTTIGSGRDGRIGLAVCLGMMTSSRERRLVDFA